MPLNVIVNLDTGEDCVKKISTNVYHHHVCMVENVQILLVITYVVVLTVGMVSVVRLMLMNVASDHVKMEAGVRMKYQDLSATVQQVMKVQPAKRR